MPLILEILRYINFITLTGSTNTLAPLAESREVKLCPPNRTGQSNIWPKYCVSAQQNLLRNVTYSNLSAAKQPASYHRGSIMRALVLITTTIPQLSTNLYMKAYLLVDCSHEAGSDLHAKYEHIMYELFLAEKGDQGVTQNEASVKVTSPGLGRAFLCRQLSKPNQKAVKYKATNDELTWHDTPPQSMAKQQQQVNVYLA